MTKQNVTNNTPELPSNFNNFYGYNARAYNGTTEKSFVYTLSSSYEFGRYASIFSPAQNDTYEVNFLLKEGSYNFVFITDKGSNRGIASVYIDNDFRTEIDCYNASTVSVNRFVLNAYIFTTGYHTLKIKIQNKNPSSTGYVFNCSAIFTSPISNQYTNRINCGGSNYIDSFNNLWLSDTYFTGGNAFDIEANVGAYTVSGTNDQTLYKFERSLDSGSFSYNIPIVSGIYTINLLFSENYHSSVGQRIGTVSLNGINIITNLDIFAEAGGKNKALIKSFTNRVLTSCVLNFTNILVNAIEVKRTA